MLKNYNINVDKLIESEADFTKKIEMFKDEERIEIYSYGLIATTLLSYFNKEESYECNYKVDKLVACLLNMVNEFDEIEIASDNIKDILYLIYNNKISDELFSILLLKYNIHLKTKEIDYKLNSTHTDKKIINNLKKEQKRLSNLLSKTDEFVNYYTDISINSHSKKENMYNLLLNEYKLDVEKKYLNVKDNSIKTDSQIKKEKTLRK